MGRGTLTLVPVKTHRGIHRAEEEPDSGRTMNCKCSSRTQDTAQSSVIVSHNVDSVFKRVPLSQNENSFSSPLFVFPLVSKSLAFQKKP